jgi:histidinol-phosphate aminotransferase
MPLVPPYIEALRPYEAGRSIEEVQRAYGLSRVSKLASNENPLGASPLAIEAMARSMGGLNLYPNSGLDLRRVLAEKYETKIENVIAGSGSEGIISNIIRAFLCDEDEVLTTEAAFLGFQVLAKSRGVAYRTVPYRDWHYDLTALAGAINERTKIVYLANPNNPTGTIFSKQEFDEFYRHVPERVLIILDEAYFEYAKDTPRYPDSMHYRYDNVITLRTFSKVYGLAGVRIGYGFAHERLITNLLKVKLPFEPSTLAQAAGIGALADKEFLHKSLELNARGLKFLTDRLARDRPHGGSLGSEFPDGGAARAPSRPRDLPASYSSKESLSGRWPASACRIAFAFPPERPKTTSAAWKQYSKVRGTFIMQQLVEHPVPEKTPVDFLPLNGTDFVSSTSETPSRRLITIAQLLE